MNNNKIGNEVYLTIADVQDYLNVSQSQAYALARRPDFPACRFGGSIRIPQSAFLIWVKKNTHKPDWMEVAM